MYESDANLIKGCKQNNRKSQELLYKKYSWLMLAVCRRYVKDRAEAEDIMMEGFMKVFKFMSSYAANGTLEGWIKRIMIFTAIDHIRKANKLPFAEFTSQDAGNDDGNIIIDEISARDILKLMDEMPEGYRLILNMFAIEGYSHKEISDAMGISEGTSKSQLCRARIFLRKLIEKTFYIQTKS